MEVQFTKDFANKKKGDKMIVTSLLGARLLRRKVAKKARVYKTKVDDN